jgi:hypothetical protein
MTRMVMRILHFYIAYNIPLLLKKVIEKNPVERVLSKEIVLGPAATTHQLEQKPKETDNKLLVPYLSSCLFLTSL